MTDHRGRGPGYLFVTSLGALGVVFGDIGTSPLYAFRETFHATHGLPVDERNVLGILSLMFWSIILVVTIKYLMFVMRADNEGEGGILALTALAVGSEKRLRSETVKVLLITGLFGTALLYGDGVITPAISVLSAVEGLEVAAPGLGSYVVPVAVLILIGLFAIQRQGTSKVGAVFGPVMVIWFAVLAFTGLIQVINHPSVLSAVWPTHALGFLTDHPVGGFLALGAVFLVVTGSEALYADMGHFGRRPINIAWFSVVFPALLLNYFGQGALLIAEPDRIDNPFYSMVPSWAVVPMIALATAAAVIASQALISGAFSLTQQAIQLGFLPRMRIDHTSPREYGQVYLGTINWVLLLSCVGTVVAFASSSALAAAYGVAVTTTMAITTLLLYVVMRQRWGWSVPLSLSITGVFLVIDLAFFAANIIKVPSGGWFPLVVGLLVLGLMLTWRRGRTDLAHELRRGELPIERFIGSIATHPQKRVRGTAVYLFPDSGMTPPALLANLRNNDVIHETVVVVSVKTAVVPRVPRAARASVHSMGEGFHQVSLRFGFIEIPDVPRALSDITLAEFGFDASDAIYILGKESVVVEPGRWWHRIRTRIFAVMHRNSANAAGFFELPSEDVMELGVQVEL